MFVDSSTAAKDQTDGSDTKDEDIKNRKETKQKPGESKVTHAHARAYTHTHTHTRAHTHTYTHARTVYGVYLCCSGLSVGCGRRSSRLVIG